MLLHKRYICYNHTGEVKNGSIGTTFGGAFLVVSVEKASRETGIGEHIVATYLFTNCLENDALWVACQKEDSGCANSVTLDFNLSVREEDER